MKAKYLLLTSIIFLLSGCTEITKEQCEREGLKFTIEQSFNFRTGEYQSIPMCYE